MITRREADPLGGVNVHSDGWSPNEEQYERYRRREIKMCARNIALGRSSDDRIVVTLHSWDTTMETIMGVRPARFGRLESWQRAREKERADQAQARAYADWNNSNA